MPITGIKFGEYHSYEEWGLKLISITIGLPEPKTVLIDIPGGDGVLDLSESLPEECSTEQENWNSVLMQKIVIIMTGQIW